MPDARFYRISAGDGVDLVGELVVSDARDLKTSYKGNLSDPSLQNRAETNEGRSLVEKIAGSPDPLQVGTVQPRANNGFVWTTPSLDTFIGNTRESGISAAYEKGNAEAVKAYMLAEAEKRGIEVPEGIEQPIVHFVLRRIESKDGKASIQDVVRMTNQSVNRGMNVYEQAKNDADVLVGAGLVPHIALRPDGRIDTAKSAEAIGRFIQETGAQGMVDENSDTLTEDGQERLQNAVLAALLGNENADTMSKMMREADRLDIENEKRALMKTAAELMRLAAAKPQYDLRQPLAEALDYYLNWRDVDERKREEAGKNRRDWYERTKDGMRRRGLTWSMHMGQGDMFRTPSPEARLLGDLLAASRDLRSFDAEDRETDAGKKRAQDLVTGFLGDYIRNADAVNTETVDLLGTPPPSRIELLETHRGTAGGGTVRFSTVKSKSAGQIQPSEDDSNPEYISHGGRVPQVVDDDVTSGLGKLADIISKNGPLEPTRFFNELARTFGFEDDNPDKSKYVRSSDFVVRLANHRANAAMFLSAGETHGNTSVVIKMSEYPFHAHKDVELKEFVYFPDKLDAAKEVGIVNALGNWVATGTYSDANADQVNVSPLGRRFSTTGLYTGSAADYEKPSILKVGTGEGSQVYGWGLYASSERGVAETYADMDAGSGNFSSRGNKAIKFKNKIVKVGDASPDEIAADFLINYGDRAEEMITSDIDNNIRANDNDHANELKAGLRSIRKFRKGFEIVDLKPHVYEQTFFTNRAPGDESHLLNWYEPVSEEMKGKLISDMRKEFKSVQRPSGSEVLLPNGKADWREGIDLSIIDGTYGEVGGGAWYDSLKKLTGSPKAASEWLADHDIDGIKYPVDSYGKTVKDGDKAGWNYVSFRDDNIRVDHKWVDGVQRFSTVQIERNVDEMLSKLDEAKGKSKEEIFKQYDFHQKVIAQLPIGIVLPDSVSVSNPVVKCAQNYLLAHLVVNDAEHHEVKITADDAKRIIGLIDPTNEMRLVEQRGSHSIAFIGQRDDGTWDCICIAPKRGEYYIFKTMFAQKKKPYQDKSLIRFSVAPELGRTLGPDITGETPRPDATSIRGASTTTRSIAQPAEKGNAPRRAFSTVGSAYPALSRLSDEQLIAIALATKTVFGKAGKKQNQHFTINAVQKHLKALHPDWNGQKISLESTRIYQSVRPIQAKLREDLARGVSESKILQHLPERLKGE